MEQIPSELSWKCKTRTSSTNKSIFTLQIIVKIC